ncbi:unnamed protein product, partial [Heligmosomoides polygyrus]|uniref:NADH dehydrogenase [ubiquinone] 1 beta subcomplex subunit 2, mitochondrial n=1 Tax=Heligmosomoides polygyrus TaxID=6339 RepID=A0A183GMX6_HELPZ
RFRLGKFRKTRFRNSQKLNSPIKSPFGPFQYGRNHSRDPKFKGVPKPLQGDNLGQFMLRRPGHAYEDYSLLFLTGFWFKTFCLTSYYSFTKIEESSAPRDWDYWKKETAAFDFEDLTRKRCGLMENKMV